MAAPARHASLSELNWKAPASSSAVGPIAQSWSASQPFALTSACRPASPAKASAPKADQTSAYALRNAANTRRRSGSAAVAVANMPTSGKLDGSIIAAIISCQAAR